MAGAGVRVAPPAAAFVGAGNGDSAIPMAAVVVRVAPPVVTCVFTGSGVSFPSRLALRPEA